MRVQVYWNAYGKNKDGAVLMQGGETVIIPISKKNAMELVKMGATEEG